jgi:hypothetical protein
MLVLGAIVAMFGLGVFGLAKIAAMAPIAGQTQFAVLLGLMLTGSLIGRRLRD